VRALVDDLGRTGRLLPDLSGEDSALPYGRARLRCLKLVGQVLEAVTLRASGECSRSRNIPPPHIIGWFGRERLNLSATGEDE
jgi:hypothetical protein